MHTVHGVCFKQRFGYIAVKEERSLCWLCLFTLNHNNKHSKFISFDFFFLYKQNNLNYHPYTQKCTVSYWHWSPRTGYLYCVGLNVKGALLNLLFHFFPSNSHIAHIKLDDKVCWKFCWEKATSKKSPTLYSAVFYLISMRLWALWALCQSDF